MHVKSCINLHWLLVVAVIYPEFNTFQDESRCEELMKSMKSYEVWVVGKNGGSPAVQMLFLPLVAYENIALAPPSR